MADGVDAAMDAVKASGFDTRRRNAASASTPRPDLAPRHHAVLPGAPVSASTTSRMARSLPHMLNNAPSRSRPPPAQPHFVVRSPRPPSYASAAPWPQRLRPVLRHRPRRARRAPGAPGQADRGDRRGRRGAAGRRPRARRRQRGQARARVHDRRPRPGALGADPARDRLDPRREGARVHRPHDARCTAAARSSSTTSTR